MPYKQTGSFNAMFNPAVAERAGFAITRAVGRRFWALVRERTPIAKIPEGWSESEWVQLRGGRKLGTLRDSIYLTPAVIAFGGFEIAVATDDPVGKWIEHGTVSHFVKPVSAQALVFAMPGGELWGSKGHEVSGITGVHMFQVGALATEAEFASIAEPILAAMLRGDQLAAVA